MPPKKTSANKDQESVDKKPVLPPKGIKKEGAKKNNKNTVETPQQGGEEGKKQRSKRRVESYNIYLYKVLKQVHGDMGISNRAMQIMNNFIEDVFDRIAAETTTLVKVSGGKTLSSRDVQTAVRLVLPGDLGKHAVSEGTKACIKYNNATKPAEAKA